MSTLVEGDLLAAPQRLADVRQVAFDENDFYAVEKLREASALFRRLSHQQISLVEGDTQELYGSWSCDLWLPQRPVLDVASVQYRLPGDDGFTVSTGFVVWRGGKLSFAGAGGEAWSFAGAAGGFWYGPGAMLQVVYDHGYEIIPEDVQTTVLSMAARAYEQGAGGGLVQSETIGSYQYTNATTPDGTPVGLTALESAVIDAYQPRQF